MVFPWAVWFRTFNFLMVDTVLCVPYFLWPPFHSDLLALPRVPHFHSRPRAPSFRPSSLWGPRKVGWRNAWLKLGASGLSKQREGQAARKGGGGGAGTQSKERGQEERKGKGAGEEILGSKILSMGSMAFRIVFERFLYANLCALIRINHTK